MNGTYIGPEITFVDAKRAKKLAALEKARAVMAEKRKAAKRASN